ncbi:2TM domain-containing protein [Winogradskyella eximia]|mgnify:CR=1 FL=1|jgi:2TM domain|uniref:2TM domain-containing protein n=1 Tax=Winogradskyella eximia TaxID=262006 RepID=A0A3D9GZR3_9FLAO|nr:2TM domain-containing protein [Winogradskyella eximia]RED42742.1 2TM domain-containing protein [Winogradskyella eximia]
MKEQDSNLKFLKAKNKVEKLKRFYTHLGVYFVINTIITVVKVMSNMNMGETFDQAFYDFSTLATWLVWGIAIALHAFSVFGLPLILGEDWEERKIEKYMNDELQKD